MIYNFIEREFSYEPPIRKKRNDVRVRHNIVPHALVAHNNNWHMLALYIIYMYYKNI